jgi:hypothetical protein
LAKCSLRRTVISPLRLQTKIRKKNPVQNPSDFSGANFRHLATKTIEFFVFKKMRFPRKNSTQNFEKKLNILKKIHQTFETTKLD